MGISSTAKRVKDSILSKDRSREDLKIGIAGFYDRSSQLWEDVWGEVRCSELPQYSNVLTRLSMQWHASNKSILSLIAYASWILYS